MKILMVNKFLYPNGGSETYVFKLGNCLKNHGHQVEYFGMEHPDRIVGNRAEVYTTNMDFHKGSLQHLSYPFRIIYSIEARKKIRQELEAFQPDVVHLNNFNYQITPSVICEIKKYEHESNKNIKIIYTAHDYQLICPNHMLYNPISHKNCEKCLGNRYFFCIRGRCIHGSFIKSFLGTLEASIWKQKKIYTNLNTIICPTRFIETKLKTNPALIDKTFVMYNFIEEEKYIEEKKENYIIFFGRFSEEKGLRTLISVCKSLPEITFVFAGKGPLTNLCNGIFNIHNVGFKSGKELKSLIAKAKFSVYPSEWYENCPFAVLESQVLGTPVLGADIGGIPELIQPGQTGELFESGNADDLKKQIMKMWNGSDLLELYTKNCKNIKFNTLSEYTKILLTLYATL